MENLPTVLMDYEVIVVGAGVQGSATAYYLASRGTSNVLLLEQVTFPCVELLRGHCVINILYSVQWRED